ncbi:MAG: KAP family NTPase [Bacteroidales bacterium]|jgi:hypothetical protein|nr:KAP family NTPase [Bacteroidales bacterium]
MNKNKHIIDYLEYYIEQQNAQYAVLLTGKWGCGKTFFIKEQIEKWKEENKYKKYKPVYIPLNGISNTEKIDEEISKWFKIKYFLPEMEINMAVVKFNLKSLFQWIEQLWKSKKIKILVFDDIERCKIDINELFGCINKFIEHCGYKVIIIANEDKLQDKYKDKYNEIKEKLVGQTLEVMSDVDNVLNHYLTEIENEYLKENKKLIKEVFDTSACNNYRILKQTLSDFCRLTFIDKYKNYNRYQEFVSSFLTYFLIVSIEIKSGKNDNDIFECIDCVTNDKKVATYTSKLNAECVKKYSKVIAWYVKNEPRYFPKAIYNMGKYEPLDFYISLIPYIRNGYIETLEGQLSVLLTKK